MFGILENTWKVSGLAMVSGKSTVGRRIWNKRMDSKEKDKFVLISPNDFQPILSSLESEK